MLLALGLLSSFATMASALSLLVSIPLATLALAHGACLSWRELVHPAHGLVIPLNATAATIDGEEMNDLALQWRGSLAFLKWRDRQGRRRRLFGWPDNLDVAARRELRLAMAARKPARPARSVAP